MLHSSQKSASGWFDESSFSFRFARHQLRVCSPPFCNLANAANFAYIDLSSDVLRGGRLISWQGDIPNFFYKLRIPHGLSEFFCLEGVTAKELYSALGEELPPGTVGNKLAIQVVCMGWSWAPYLAQTAAEDVLSCFCHTSSFLYGIVRGVCCVFRGSTEAALIGK